MRTENFRKESCGYFPQRHREDPPVRTIRRNCLTMRSQSADYRKAHLFRASISFMLIIKLYTDNVKQFQKKRILDKGICTIEDLTCMLYKKEV